MVVEVSGLDLKNNQITLGELWDDPRSRGVFQKKVPMLARHPVRGAARTVTREQRTDFMASGVPGPVISGVMRDLKQL